MKVALLGDLHYYSPKNSIGDFHGAFYNSILKAFFENPYDYYISLGDVTHFGSHNEFVEIYSEINRHPNSEKFQQILGNHDAITQTKSELERELGYPLYRSIDNKEAKLIFLDTTREQSPDNWIGIVDEGQLAWLEKEIRESGTKPVLVFGHHPLYNTTDHSTDQWMYIQNYTEVDAILRGKQGRGIFFNGHNHTNSIAESGKWTYVQSGAILCSLSYREVEITENEIKVSTVFIKNEELDHQRHLTASHLDKFEIIPSELADGTEKDHTLRGKVLFK